MDGQKQSALDSLPHTLRGTAQDKQSPGAGVTLTGVTAASDNGSELKQIEARRNESSTNQLSSTHRPRPRNFTKML